MNSRRYLEINALVLCMCLITASLVMAQTQSQGLKAGGQTLIPKKDLGAKFSQLMQTDRGMRALDQHLKAKGFTPLKRDQDFWGISGTKQKDNKTANYSLSIRNYAKANSRDAGALAQVVVSAPGASKTYSFYLIAQNGDFRHPLEFTVNPDGTVVQAKSWWTCVKSRLNKVGGKCAEALLGCAPSLAAPGGGWAAYLGCVAENCAYAFAEVSACCACNGDTWCRWAVGSCSQKEGESSDSCAQCSEASPCVQCDVDYRDCARSGERVSQQCEQRLRQCRLENCTRH